MREKIKGLLEDTVVLDLADERGSFCSRLLADLGASVIKVETPCGKSSRHIGPFYTPCPRGGSFNLSLIYNNLNKRSIALDAGIDKDKRLFEKLVEKADVLIETPSPEYQGNFNLDPLRLRSINPRLVHLSITAFGRNDRKQSFRFSENTAVASGGQMFVCRDKTGKPVKLYGSQAYYTASLYGAVAILLHLSAGKDSGTGSYIDLSIQEAVTSTLDHVMVDYFSRGTIYRPPAPYSGDRNFTLLPCRDGHMLISIQQNWETLIEILASENMAEDLTEEEWARQAFREDHFDHIVEVVKRWTVIHSKQELFELGQAMHFPWAPVVHPDEVLRSHQLQFRRFFINIDKSGQYPRMTLPGSPYIFSSCSLPAPEPPPSTGEHTSQIIEEFLSGKKYSGRKRQNSTKGGVNANENSLKGCRVLDLTRMLSGPFCTRILADAGAEVIKVQTKKTATGAEQNGSAYFRTWNRNKRSISLDLSTREARDCLVKLATISDILVENYSPRVMNNWGLSYEKLKKTNPSLIMLSISAMGQTGPWKDYVGFGPTFHVLSGLTAASSAESDSPIVIGHAYGDIVIGLYAAFAILAALEFRDRAGEGQYIDLSGYEAMCTFLGPALMRIDEGFDDGSTVNGGAGCSSAASDYCFPCKGADRWCAVTINSDEDWQLLRNFLDLPDLDSDSFSSPARRRENRDELERLMAYRTKDFSADFIAEGLHKAGIAACVVQNAEDLAKDSRLLARNFFISLKHSSLGSTISDRSALWPFCNGVEGWNAAPELGEDNYDVFVRLMGMPEEIYRSFIQRGIIR